jgi:cysteine-rich repeat protein
VVVSCGDGIVDIGEVCDDGNVESADGCRGDCQKIELCGDALVDDGEACDDGNDNGVDGCNECMATRWRASALVGGSTLAAEAELHSPTGVTVDVFGNVFIADSINRRILRVDVGTSVVTTIAGNGSSGATGDGGPATSAGLGYPQGVAVDGLGNVFVTGINRVRRIDGASGLISTVAGGASGSGGDGGPATSAELEYAADVVVDGLGNLFIADRQANRVRRVDASTRIITTFAGGGQPPDGLGDDGPATSARLNIPLALALDGAGNLLIAEQNGRRIRRVNSATGVIETVAGGGSPGDGIGDNGPAVDAALISPHGIAVGETGDIFIADRGHYRLRKVDASTGDITTVAGVGVRGFAGDGGAALSAEIEPVDVAVDAQGNLIFSDASHRVRDVDVTTGLITTMAGTGSIGHTGDGGSARSASLREPYDVAVDSKGNLFISEWVGHRIRRVDGQTGTITTVAGSGLSGFSGDDGSALLATVYYPKGLAVDASDNLYFADERNDRIRRIDGQTGVITTVAGGGSFGLGDNGPATDAVLDRPSDVVIDGSGNLYIADTDHARIRHVEMATGIITTFAGGGGPDLGDDGPASSARLQAPTGVEFDAGGNLLIADFGTKHVRHVDIETNIITTIAGGGSLIGDDREGALATDVDFRPYDVAVDGNGDFLIPVYEKRVYRVDTLSRVVSTLAGTGFDRDRGDGGPADVADVTIPTGIAIDDVGNVLFVGDRVRRVDATTGNITTVAGLVSPKYMGSIAQARLSDPQALALGPNLSFFAGGVSGTAQAIGNGWLDVVAGRYPHLSASGDLARFRAQDFGSVTGVALNRADDVLYMTSVFTNQAVPSRSAHVIHEVTPVDPEDPNTWTIATLAGDDPGFADGAAGGALFREPAGLYFDESAAILYVADRGNHAIRAIDVSAGRAAASVSTFAGTVRNRGFAGDGAAAVDALFYSPSALTRCPNGDFFIADAGNHRVRRIEAGSGIITTVVGDGSAASAGQGFPAVDFPVNDPNGLACDAAGNLFVTSSSSVRLLPADAAGIVDGSGEVQTIFGEPPRQVFPASVTRCLTGVAVVDDTTLWLTDSCVGMLVELSIESVP